MRTTEAILAEIHKHKTCSKQQLYRYFAAFNITPVGVRQRPRLYPDDSAERILKQLGLSEGAGCGKPDCPNAAPDPTRHTTALVVKSRIARPHVVSMRELKAERAKSARRAA